VPIPPVPLDELPLELELDAPPVPELELALDAPDELDELPPPVPVPPVPWVSVPPAHDAAAVARTAKAAIRIGSATRMAGPSVTGG
jgi:hypothetical protein